MKKPPRTERRGGQWYYRRRVPQVLISTLGFGEYRESLHTTDMAVARIKAAIRDAEVTVELQAAQALLKATTANISGSKSQDKLSPAELIYIREAVKAHTLRLDEEFRQSQPDEDSRIAHSSIMAEHFEDSGKALANGLAYFNKQELGRVQEALRAVGIDVSPESVSWKEAAFKATEGYNLAQQAIYKRDGGEYFPTPDAPVMAVVVAGSHGNASGSLLSLGSVTDSYLATIKQSDYTRKIERCLQLFCAVIGRDTPVKEIRQKRGYTIPKGYL